MAPLIYPEPTWSNRFGRVVRTLQVVAVAGAIGAVGGGVAVMALVGNGSAPRHATVLKASTDDNSAAHPLNAAPAGQQPNAAAAAVQIAPAASEVGAQQAPAAGAPSSNDTATDQHPIEQAAVPADSAAGTPIYNRVDPEQKSAPAHAPRAHAKVTRRIKNAERDRGKRGVPYPDQGYGPYSGERYSYGGYSPSPGPRGYSFGNGGGGVFYDRRGWSSGGWGY